MRMSIPMYTKTFVDSFNGLLGWYKCDYLRTIAITKLKKMYQKSSFAAWWINPNHSNGANLYIQISAIAYFDMDYWIFAILRKWWALNQINIIYNTLVVWKFSCSTFFLRSLPLGKKNRIWEYRRNQKSYFSRSSPLFITRMFSRTKQWNRTFFCFNNS